VSLLFLVFSFIRCKNRMAERPACPVTPPCSPCLSARRVHHSPMRELGASTPCMRAIQVARSVRGTGHVPGSHMIDYSCGRIN
jgi:hypothetical protein